MDDASFVHMEELLRKDTEGEFEIERRLGKGGMAVVYLATEVHLSRKVAVKVLPPELTFGHGVERFKREAKTAAALDHNNIIPIYRIASGGKIFWYAMKYLEGKSLDDLLREKKRFSLEETIDILDQVADGLDYAHEHQVIHRDVKPANVMLDSRNRVTVTDFGIAKALTEGTLTASGSVVGTPYYMSPEQGMGRPVTGAADQYSVGVMAYRMLSGHVPFEGESAVEILHKHCMLPAPPLSTVMGGLPDHVYYAVHKALEKKPENRFSSVRAFVDALRAPSEEMTLGEQATVVVSTEEVSKAMSSAAPWASGTGAPPSVADMSGATVPMSATPPPESRAAITPVTPPILTGVARREKKGNKVLMFALLGAISIGGGAGVMWMLSRGGGGGDQPGAEPPGGPQVAQGSGGAQQPAGPAVTATQDSAQVRDSLAALAAAAQRDTQSTQVAQAETPAQTPQRPAQRETTPRQAPVQRESPPAVTPAAPTTGGIVLAGLPPDATVLLDGPRYRGNANAPIRGLEPGSHRILVRAPGREDFDVNVTVAAGVDRRVTYVAGWQSYLWIRIRPATGADEITIDGRTVARGVAEHRDTLTADRSVLISVTKEGYVRTDTTVALMRGDHEVRIVLRRN